MLKEIVLNGAVERSMVDFNLATEDLDFYQNLFEDCKDRVCEAIRSDRETLGLSVRTFAKKIGISAPYLSDIELGRRFPSEKVLTKIVNLLGARPKNPPLSARPKKS